MHPFVVAGLFTVLAMDAYLGGRMELMWALIVLGAYQYFDLWQKQRAADKAAEAEYRRKYPEEFED